MSRLLVCSLALSTLLVAGAIPTAYSADEPANPTVPVSTTAPNANGNGNADIDLQDAIAKARTLVGTGGSTDPKKFRDFNEVTKDAHKLDGFFTLYQKDDHLYGEIKPMQLGQTFMSVNTLARGVEMAGNPLDREAWIILFKRVGDKIQLVRRQVRFKAPSGTPIEKAVQQNYTDSILMALPIVSINPAGQGVLIDFNDIFFNNFAELPLGSVDRNRTSWYKVKAFPNNLELEAEMTFMGGGGLGSSDNVADRRGITVVLHHSFIKLPDPGYQPRMADDRVGFFLNSVRDFGMSDPESRYARMINRWRLEKANPSAKLSAPKKQIVWYVEDNVPFEYRPFVEEGILEWNKAFEKIGFRNAIAVRWQEAGRDDFDPEDINYCTFRWIATSSTFAMSCLRSNPITGEMIDGDVIFDASWINHWKTEYALLTGKPGVTSQGDGQDQQPLGIGEIISPAMAAKYGYGSPQGIRPPFSTAAQKQAMQFDLIPAGISPIQWDLSRKLAQRSANSSYCHYQMRSAMGIAAIAFASGAVVQSDQTPPPSKPGTPETKLPEELIGQAIKEVVMHEVGHSLGLRHNFKSSTMLKPEQLHDTSITRVKGLTGSVMDYAPINLASKGQKQGDFFSTTIGPYDYWAIEYAYKPITGSESDELKKIATRAPEPDLVFGSDEDTMLNSDPFTDRYDLSSDPMTFAKDRMALATELLKDLDAKVVKEGESWAKLRQAFSILLNEFGDGSYRVSSFIGGQSISRDHKGDKNGRDPVMPVAGPKQREALTLLVDQIFSDKAFQFSPALLRRLGNERWEDSTLAMVELSIYDRILGIQKIGLDQCLNSSVLNRLQDQELQSDKDGKPLTIAEVFRALGGGIWSELEAAKPGATVSTSIARRNLQREHITRLISMVLGSRGGGANSPYGFMVLLGGGSTPPDARALARLHLKELDAKLKAALETKDCKVDDSTRAHFEESRHRIGKAINADVSANEP